MRTPILECPRFSMRPHIAGMLGITERHVRRLVLERRIPFAKVGRFVRFDPRDIEQWVQAAKVPTVTPRRHHGAKPTPGRRHMSRRTFGSTRKLPSGQWQASYWHEGATFRRSRHLPDQSRRRRLAVIDRVGHPVGKLDRSPGWGDLVRRVVRLVLRGRHPQAGHHHGP